MGCSLATAGQLCMTILLCWIHEVLARICRCAVQTTATTMRQLLEQHLKVSMNLCNHSVFLL